MGVMSNVHYVGGRTQTQRVKSIKFRATFPKAESFGLHQVKEVEFKLGLGPCGKHVLHLKHEIADDLLTITQWARNPDDLEEPTNSTWAIQEKLERHAEARKDPIHTYEVEVSPAQVVERGWWIFKSSCTYGPIMKTIERPNRYLLEPSEVTALHDQITAIYKAHQEWQDRLEVKTFVYKMADGHGRIEVLK